MNENIIIDKLNGLDLNKVVEKYLLYLEDRCINSFAFKNDSIFPRSKFVLTEFINNLKYIKDEFEKYIKDCSYNEIHNQVLFLDHYYDVLSDKFHANKTGVLFKNDNFRMYFNLIVGLKNGLIKDSELYRYLRDIVEMYNLMNGCKIKFDFRCSKVECNKFTIRTNTVNTILVTKKNAYYKTQEYEKYLSNLGYSNVDGHSNSYQSQKETVYLLEDIDVIWFGKKVYRVNRALFGMGIDSLFESM